MRDLTQPRAMWLKAILLLAVRLTSFVLLAIELRSLQGVLLLVVSIWAFCRTYYFAFYVIQKYVDATFRFSGLLSFVRYLLTRKSQP